MSEIRSSTLAFFDLEVPPPPVRDSPFDCLWRDTKNLAHHIKLLPSVLSQFSTKNNLDELYMHGPSLTSLIWLIFWSIIQSVPVVFGLVCTLMITGIVTALTKVYSFMFWRWIQGPQYQVHPTQLPPSHSYDSCHRWVYINGVATTKDTLAQELAYLHQLFHDPIVGVNNRTYGFLGDLFECVIQRSFSYHTKETRLAYKLIKSYLLQDSSAVSKVILIAHSQGGILASHVLDSLLLDSDVSPSHLAKLEIYTFGSAALTVNNPFTNATRTERTVKVIEHYCNENDMVTSWGALSSCGTNKHGPKPGEQPTKLDQQKGNNIQLPFMGKVFIRKGRTGHMFNQHYLRAMLDDTEDVGNDKKSVQYLDCAVQRIDNHSNTDRIDVPQLEGDARYIVQAREANSLAGEKSVKDVSQLWKYMQVSH